MALPNLPSTYSARRNAYEAAIHSRRSREQDHHNRWNQTASYFQDSGVKAARQQRWESNTSFQNSMDAYKRQQERELKVIQLQQRRRKLAALLESENKRFQQELQQLTPRARQDYGVMKDRAETLRSAREDRRQEVANERLYEHFKLNNPDLRELESKQFQKHVVGEWRGQEDERKETEAQAHLEEAEMEAELEAERRVAVELERRLQATQLDDERHLRKVQRQQMEELKQRETQAEALKDQERILLQQQVDLDMMEERRKQMEEQRKKLEFGKVLLRQHAAALRRRSRQVQEELEQDLQFLTRLSFQEKQDEALKTSRKERARADAEWMQQVVEEQLTVERAREAELNQLYQDEAAKMWADRESEWKRERAARERLMEEVLLGRQEQIRDRLVELQKKQEESLEQREQLIRDLELAQRATRRDEEKGKDEMEERRRELVTQMTSRHDAHLAHQLNVREQLEREKEAEAAYEEMLRHEARRMEGRGFEPKNFGKRQAWS